MKEVQLIKIDYIESKYILSASYIYDFYVIEAFLSHTGQLPTKASHKYHL